MDWSSLNGGHISWFVGFLLAALIVFAFYRDWRRRRTLRRRKDGIWVWEDWHGGERSSTRDPREPGGDWSSDGGGGDGGGGGGE